MSAAAEFDKRNRNAFGKLYMPSQKFGVETTAPNGAFSSIGCYVKARAVEIASEWTGGEPGRTATIYRRSNPVCKMIAHYFNDGRQQIINY